MAGRGTEEGRRKPPGSGGHKRPIRARKLRSRGQKSRDGAPGGARVLQKRTRQDEYGCALSALHPPHFARGEEGKTVYPAPQNHGRFCLHASRTNPHNRRKPETTEETPCLLSSA